MSFDSYGAAQNGGNTSTKSVNFDELNAYVVETAELEQRETLVGYVSMIVDLGTQEQPDAEVVFNGTEEDERKAVAEMPDTYFKDGIDPVSKNKVRYKCWPQKPVQCVAVAVDFPEIIVDKGSFFGESKPLPLRLWLGGQFYIENVGMVVGRPTPLKVNKKLGDWSLDQKNLFHKMAVAAKIIKPNEVFVPQRIDELLGKAFQFEAQVFFKESKGKKYYTEYVKFVSGLGRGQTAPEHITTPMLIQFNKENPEDAVKELRAHVVNTIKKASNYEGSVIQKQIESLRGGSSSSEAPKEEVKASKPVKAKKAEKAPNEGYNAEVNTEHDPDLDDCPF
tara:strand:+ start:29349 stop:30353 length:1005 start_codon:yes stop_codon:yes gene_type:complete